MLTELAGDGKYRLARFHATRKFLTNEIYHILRLLLYVFDFGIKEFILIGRLLRVEI